MANKPKTRTERLVEELRYCGCGLSVEEASAFAEVLMRKAAQYKPAGVQPHVERKHLLQIAKSMRAAVAAVEAAEDQGVHWDATATLSVYASRKRPRDRADHALTIDALKAHMNVYAETAQAFADTIPPTTRGHPPDFENFRPALLVAGAWIEVFGARPSTDQNSPFIMALGVALPLFRPKPPANLGVHAAEAFRQAGGIDRMMRSARPQPKAKS